jgi:UDPglucose 6-dehydrogenase
MKVSVVGLWHLGTVTAACLASGGHDVTGIEFDAAVVDRLNQGIPPLFEPGLEDLVRQGIAEGRLRFAADPAAVAASDLLWVAYDTPVDDDDRADVEFVVDRVRALFPHLADGAIVLVSSQLPVGTTGRLETEFSKVATGRSVHFAYSPENLRLGHAITVFTKPDRVVVGVRDDRPRSRIMALLAPFTNRIEWMSVESAEMTKHALNAFLATSVTFINEIASICEQVGADAGEVARGLKTEARIGPKAYLGPGGAFAGGTLARDIVFLSGLGRAHGLPTHVLSSVKESNDAHRKWAQRRLSEVLGQVRGRHVAVWGLTYKPGTDTLRRSSAVELCEWMAAAGVGVRAHDPAVKVLPPSLAASIDLAADPLEAVQGADALVVATPWPAYRDVPAAAVREAMARPLVLDANRFLDDSLGRQPGVQYLSVGRPTR